MLNLRNPRVFGGSLSMWMLASMRWLRSCRRTSRRARVHELVGRPQHQRALGSVGHAGLLLHHEGTLQQAGELLLQPLLQQRQLGLQWVLLVGHLLSQLSHCPQQLQQLEEPLAQCREPALQLQQAGISGGSQQLRCCLSCHALSSCCRKSRRVSLRPSSC